MFFFLSFLSSLRYCCQHRYASPPIVSRITTELPLLDASPRFLFFRAKQQIGEMLPIFSGSQKLVAIKSAKKKRNEKVSWHTLATSSLVVVGIFDRGGKTTKF